MTNKLHDSQHGGPPLVIVEAAAAKIAVRILSVIFTLYAQLQGLGILIGGKSRFSTDHSAYEIASSFPGGNVSWGLSMFLLGVIGFFSVTLDHRRTSFVVFSLLAFWSFGFAICFARAAAIFTQVSTTGMWTYGKDAAVFITLAAIVYSNPYRKER